MPDGDHRRVLDPAVGSGGFLLAAHERFDSIDADAPPDCLGVDTDPLAVDLAESSLAVRSGRPPDETGVREQSFFDLDPESVGPVDSVVGNPPYIRASDLSPDVAHFRRHLRSFAPTGDGRYHDGPERLSERSDAYVYFVTHATEFLRDGGRLGVVLPTKWLTSEYGEGFQRFLRDHYDVRAVVGFDRRSFEDALIDTLLLFAERRSGDGTGETTRFVRFDEPTGVDALLETVDGERTGSRDGSTTVRVPASRFGESGAGPLGQYLRAPQSLSGLFDHPQFVHLSELATVTRGVMTGANRFFFVDGRTVNRWGIEERFLRPALKSVRGVETRVLRPEDISRYIVDVHDYVERFGGADDPEAATLRALERDGYDGLRAYVDHADGEGWNGGSTCQRRAVWFDLGDLPTPDVFVPKLLRDRVFTIRNAVGAVPSNAIDCLVADGVDAPVLAGVLHSSLVRAMMEVRGRDEAGMLQLMTYETRSLPVPDVRRYTRAERDAVRDAIRRVESAADEASVRALDRAVMDPLDVELSVGEARRLRARLLRRRVEGGDRPGVRLEQSD